MGKDYVASMFWGGVTGNNPNYTRGFVDTLWKEMSEAMLKHGAEQTPVNPDMKMEEKLVILVEEVGEVARAMTYDEGNVEQLYKELVQVAAMASMAAMSLKADK